jgi:hypothetical protein
MCRTLTMGTVSILPVRDKDAIGRFISLPFRLYAQDPNWVAPLLADHRRELDARRNPFFEHATGAYFLAVREGSVVGRISAHTDERYNEFHSDGARDSTGFWGFFECDDDPAAAAALFDAAGTWLAQRGKSTMLGPASFTLNDVAGLLVDGFDSPPMVMMSYNPAYYASLVERAGFEKAQDLWAYRLDASAEIPAEIRAFARTAEDDGFTFRSMDGADYWAEVRRFIDVYNEAWERNWGFVPLTRAEIEEHARRLRHVIDPSLVVIAERDGATAAVGLTLPDVNEELVRYRGRLGPRGTLRMLTRIRRHDWRACRVVALGVKAAFRRSGVGAHLYVDTMQAARRRGLAWGEMSWILESNAAMNAGIRHMGGTVYKTYRMYTRTAA